jgi:hypothetical protein
VLRRYAPKMGRGLSMNRASCCRVNSTRNRPYLVAVPKRHVGQYPRRLDWRLGLSTRHPLSFTKQTAELPIEVGKSAHSGGLRDHLIRPKPNKCKLAPHGIRRQKQTSICP